MKYSKHHQYNNKEGTEVPSVTTILKLLAKPALMKWANYMGFKRQSIEAILEEKADIGTNVHFLIECLLMEKILIWMNSRHSTKKLMQLFLNQFLNWKKEHEVKPIFMEKELVSDRFGGTVDFYGEIDGMKTILDFKTSKTVYSSMFLQLSAYVLMAEENGYVVDQVAILCVNPDKFTYKTMTREQIDKYTKSFESLVTLFHSWYDINLEDKWGNILK